jgi:hypothetical protein
MKLTREVISEAINLGKDFLPNFTATELAKVLNVPLIAVLKCIQANRKVFRFSPDKRIEGLDATSAIQTMNSNEVWNWYLTKRLGGDANRCMPLSDQNRLNASVNSRVKWEQQFGLVTCTFASLEASGADVAARVSTVYGADISARLTRLGTVNGSGQIPDRYLFGVIITEAETAARKVGSIALYSPEWAMEEMLTEIDWVVIETGPRPGAQWIPKDEMPLTAPPPETEETPQKPEDDSAVLAQAAAAKAAAAAAPNQPSNDKKINRRTKEQLDAERFRMNSHLIELGVEPAVAVQCLNIEKFKEAEEHYKTVLASLSKVASAPPAAVPVAAPEAPKQQELPGTTEARNAPPQPEGPMVVTPPAPAAATHTRQSMPTLASLEGVADLKADIRAKAGGVAPQPITTPAAPPPMAAAVAQAPTVPQFPPSLPAAAPPVAAPVAPGASTSAEDLLNSLLKTTGQA